MTRRALGRSTRLLSVAIILALAFAAGAAVTAISAPPSTTFYGCVLRAGGSLYAIGTSPSTCRIGDSQISWNQQGVQGLPGPIGPQGIQGTPGIDAPMQIAGNILSDGTTRVDSGSGFVSSRSGVGEYVLSFPDGTWNGTTRPIIVVSPASSVGPTPVIGTLGLITWADTGSLVVNAFFYDVNGNPVDTEWNFVVTQS